MPGNDGIREELVPFAQAAAFQRDNSPPTAARRFERDNWPPALPAAPCGDALGILTADFGSFSAMPSICSRRSISRQTSSGFTPADAHRTVRL